MKKKLFVFIATFAFILIGAVCLSACEEGPGNEPTFCKITMPEKPAHVATMQCNSFFDDEPGAQSGAEDVKIYIELETGWTLGTLKFFANGVEMQPDDATSSYINYAVPKITEDVSITYTGEAVLKTHTIGFSLEYAYDYTDGGNVQYTFERFTEVFQDVNVELSVDGELTAFATMQDFANYAQEEHSYPYGSTIQFAFYIPNETFKCPLIWWGSDAFKITVTKSGDTLKTLYTFDITGDTELVLNDANTMTNQQQVYVVIDEFYEVRAELDKVDNQGRSTIDQWVWYKNWVEGVECEISVYLSDNTELMNIVSEAIEGTVQVKVNGESVSVEDLILVGDTFTIKNVKAPWEYENFNPLGYDYTVTFEN